MIFDTFYLKEEIKKNKKLQLLFDKNLNNFYGYRNKKNFYFSKLKELKQKEKELCNKLKFYDFINKKIVLKKERNER